MSNVWRYRILFVGCAIANLVVREPGLLNYLVALINIGCWLWIELR